MNVDLKRGLEWETPEGFRRVQTIDAHTAGEPFRVILSGYPELEGSASITGRHEFLIDPYDPLREGLILR